MTAEGGINKREIDYGAEYDLMNPSMEPMTPVRDTDYLSDPSSDSEYSSSYNSQFLTLTLTLLATECI